jgi:hypothetical protein
MTTLLTALPTPAPTPTPHEFYFNTPLYEPVTFAAGQNVEACQIVYATGSIDAYCPECNTHSIFRSNHSEIANHEFWLKEKVFHTIFHCTRSRSHELLFVVKVDAQKRSVQKIGQYPSLADLSMHDVKKYSGVLEKATFRELTKAIGLAAHGVGVGSFVYLRRIFENLVEDAHQEAKSAEAWAATGVHWDEDAYQRARMGERIQQLRGHLPAFLVDNREMYGILSKGVHELSEQECLAAFPVIKIGIEIILDAKLEADAKRKKLAQAAQAIKAISSGNKPYA